MKVSRWRFFSRALLWTAIVCLYVPLFSVFYLSFFQKIPATTDWVFSLQGFERLLDDTDLKETVYVSIVIASLSTLGATILGTALAIATNRGKFPGRRILKGLATAPLVLPELVLGLSFLVWFILLGVTLGRVSILLAHVTFCLSFVFISVQARILELDRSLDEAAYDLGATPFQTFWRITFPLLLPSILSGAVMSFVMSFDDFFITFFTAGVGVETLPIKIYSMTKYGIGQDVNALSTILLILTFAGLWIAFRLQSSSQNGSFLAK